MTNKPARTMQEMAEAAAGGLKCPRCHCNNFATYGGSQGQDVRFRYKQCRHCGHKILTSTKSVERIVRDVTPHDDDDDGENMLVQFG